MLNVQMNEPDWIRILQLLSNYPFKQVAPLIQTIQQQLQQQVKPQMLRPNGPEAEQEARVN